MAGLPFDALVLAGGRARRLGGAAKPLLDLGGSRLLDRVLAAAAGAHRRIVVGPDPEAPAADVVTREQPPGGGPVAALAAGLPYACCPVVAVLAADLPFLTPGVVESLTAAVGGTNPPAARAPDVALLVDDEGHEQYLIAAWRTARLREIVAGQEHPGGSMRAVLAKAAGPVQVHVPVETGAPPPWLDCDTEDDLARARGWAG